MGLREKSKRAIFNGSKIGKKYRKKRVKVAENSDKESIFLFLRIAAKKRLFYLRIAAKKRLFYLRIAAKKRFFLRSH